MWGAAISGAAAACDTLSRDNETNERHRHSHRRGVTPKDRDRLNASGFDIIVTENKSIPGLRRCRYNLVTKEKEAPTPRYEIWYTSIGRGNILHCTLVECSFSELIEQLRYLEDVHPHHMFWYEEVD